MDSLRITEKIHFEISIKHIEIMLVGFIRLSVPSRFSSYRSLNHRYSREFADLKKDANGRFLCPATVRSADFRGIGIFKAENSEDRIN